MGISFTIIPQHASEVVDSTLQGVDFVAAVARQKMEHANLPVGIDDQICYVLTADSLCADAQGKLYAKPVDRTDAVAQLKALRSYGQVVTAFCLEKRIWKGQWQLVRRIEGSTVTDYVLDLSDADIEQYLDKIPGYINTSGSLTVEGYGAQFMKTINGSYTGALGLPLCELRAALQELGYFQFHHFSNSGS
jgi:septum formation protein